MSDEAEFRRELAALEGRFLRPPRADLRALAGALSTAGGDATGPRLWHRAVASGVIPAGFAEDPDRRFGASVAEQRALGQTARVIGGLATPPSAQAALLLASDPAGLARAEVLARAVIERLTAWGAPAAGPVIWCLHGHAEDQRGAGGPRLGALRQPLGVLRAVLGGTRRIGELSHAHRRFQHVVDLLTWARRARQLASYEVPARVQTPAGSVAVNPELVGRALGELPDPLAPGLELISTGYQLWALYPRARGGAELQLAAPFGPRRDLGRRGRSEAQGPQPVWSSRTSALRLAAARGDRGTLRALLPLQPRVEVPGEPPLASYAAYAGPESLEVLREHGWLALEARDRDASTALMIAASLPNAGPAGGLEREIAVPISALVGAASCRYLVAAGASLEARDRHGHTALHRAVLAGHDPCVAALLELGADIDARDHRGRTPSMLALDRARGQSFGLLELLAPHEPEVDPILDRLLAASPDVDARDDRGWSGLHYLARATSGHAPRSLVRGLTRAGATPSRDRLGMSPADLCAALEVHHHDQGPFDLRAPVAAGPGPWRRLDPPAGLVARLVDGVCELRAARQPSRMLLDDWRVWADWLESQGDPRAEIVATSVACVGVGGRARRELQAQLAALEARHAVTLDRGLASLETRRAGGAALPLVMRASTDAEARAIWRTHGFVTRVDLDNLRLGSHAMRCAALEQIGAHQPLLAMLEAGPHVGPSLLGWEFDWPAFVAELAGIERLPQIRHLLLRGLPSEPPPLVGLDRALPGVRALSIRSQHHLARVELAWPGLTTLRIAPGPRRRGGSVGLREREFTLSLALPALSRFELDFGELPPAGLLANLARSLDQLPALRHLRVRRAPASVVDQLARGATLARLTSLELGTYDLALLTQLYEHADAFAGVERLVLVSDRGPAPGGVGVAELRARLPRLVYREVLANPRWPALW